MIMEPTGKFLALFVLFQVYTSISCRLCDFSIESLASRWIRKPCAFSFNDRSETKYVGFEFRLKDSEETRRAFATAKANFNEFFYSPLTHLNDSCDCNEVPCLNEEQLNNLFVLSVEQAWEEAKWRCPFIPTLCCSVQQALVEIIYRLDKKQLANLKKFTLKEINTRKCIACLINELRQTEWCVSFKVKCDNVIDRIFKGCDGKIRKKRDIDVKTSSMCGPSACQQDIASVSPTPLMKEDDTSVLRLQYFARTSTEHLASSKTCTLENKASHNESKSVTAINSGSSDISQNKTVNSLTPSPSGSWKLPTMVLSGAQSVSPLKPAYMTPPVVTREAVEHYSTVSYPTSNAIENSQMPNTMGFRGETLTKKLSASKTPLVTLSLARTTREASKPASAEKSSTLTSMHQSTNTVKKTLVTSALLTFTNSVSIDFGRYNSSTKSGSSAIKLQNSFVFSSALLVPVLPLPMKSSSLSSSSLKLQSSKLTARPLLPILKTHVSSSSLLPSNSSGLLLSSSTLHLRMASFSFSPSLTQSTASSSSSSSSFSSSSYSSSLSLSSSSSLSSSLSPSSSSANTTRSSVVRSVTAKTSSSLTVQLPSLALSVPTALVSTEKTSSSPPSISSVTSLSSSWVPSLFVSSSASSPPVLSALKPSAGPTPLEVSSSLSTPPKQTFIEKTSIISEITKQGSLSLTSLGAKSLSFSGETNSYFSFTKTRLASSSILQTLMATPTKPGATVPGVIETFLIRLKGNCSFIINKEDFKFTFIAMLTNLLRISRHDVIVYDVNCGSVDVTFGVKGPHRNLTSELWAMIRNESFVLTYIGTEFVAFYLREISRPFTILTKYSTPSQSTPTKPSAKHERKRIVFIVFVLIGSVFAALFIFFLVVFLARFCGCCQKTGKFRMRKNVRLHAPFETELKRFAACKNIFPGVNYYGEITQLEESRKEVHVEIVEDDIDEEFSELHRGDTNISLLNGNNHADSDKPQEHKFVFDDDGSCSSVVFY